MQTKAFGYVRVSSKDQNIDRQVNEMHAIGINERDKNHMCHAPHFRTY